MASGNRAAARGVLAFALPCVLVIGSATAAGGRGGLRECGCWRFVRPEGPPAGTSLTGISASADGAALAIGDRRGAPLALAWRAGRWREVPLPLPADTLLTGVTSITARSGWIAGRGPDGEPRILRREEGAWRPVTLPGRDPAFPRAIEARGDRDAWLTGSVSGVTGTRATTWHWDGRSWRTIPIPDLAGRSSELVAVSARGRDDVWAVGGSGAYPPRQLLLHWNGRAWHAAPGPRLPGESTLADVVTLRSGEAWAVGSMRGPQGDVPLAERWTGGSWRAVPMPGKGRLHSVAADGSGGVWASGEDGGGRPLLAQWTGGRWDMSRPPLPPAVISDPADGLAGSGSAAGLANVPGTGRLWAVGRYGNPAGRAAITWTNAPRPR